MLRAALAAGALALLLLVVLLGAGRPGARAQTLPVGVNALLAEATKFVPEVGSTHSNFGYSVALSADGNTALIGAQHTSAGAAAAWVFTRSGSVWTQQGPPLTPSGETESSEPETCSAAEGEGSDCGFGRSLALSADGNTALIGSPADNKGRGGAWVFTRSGGTWSQQGAKLLAREKGAGGNFGRSVALSADGATALISGAANDAHQGAVWPFARSGATWAQQGARLADGESDDPLFGRSVALSAAGDTALVGDPGAGSGKGVLHVFVRTGTEWAPQGAALSASDEQGEGALGASVSLSGDGNVALAGARRDNEGAGAAWVFTRAAGSWTQTGAKLTGPGLIAPAKFGYSVALSSDGRRALIGAPGDARHAGSAWVFANGASGWSLDSSLTAVDELGAGWFGSSVALSGDGATALVGGTHDNEGAGAAWPFFDPTITPPSEEHKETETENHEENQEKTGEPEGGTPTTTTTTTTPPTTTGTVEVLAAKGELATVSSLAPTPVFGVSGNIEPLSGLVRVKLPGSKKFIFVTGLRQVPFGTIVDARHGKVEVTTVTSTGVTQSLAYYSGEFRLNQARSGLVYATLYGGNFKQCKRPKKAHGAAVAQASSTHASPKHVVRKLWANGHGSYGTKGNYASGAVLGTRWLTEDRCDGTMIIVYTDKVAVTNLLTHRRHTVTAGHSYLVKAP